MSLSKTDNVKLGVCRAYFGGIDLGLTKGGVEVTVKTETHKVNVDQYGKTTVKETIMSREVAAKVPMAETTLENLVQIMPGATLSAVGGAKAAGTITLPSVPTAGQTVIVNGLAFTFKAAAAAANEVTIGGTAAVTAANLAAALNASNDPAVALATYTVAAAVVTVTYDDFGTDGNSFTLAAGTSGATLSGATLTGGTVPTSKVVTVTTGTEQVDLLTLAKELRLHPVSKPIADKSEDFVIPLAGTPGGINFAYKLEDERVYNAEFTGYPTSQGILFSIGG